MIYNVFRIKYWKPRFNNAGPNEHRRTPVYILLANEAKQRSIELTPLLPLQVSTSVVSATGDTLPSNASHSTPSSSSGFLEDVDMISPESSQSSLNNIWPDKDFKSPKVLISGKLET